MEIVSKILALYSKWGASDYIGESITQTEHALQCAHLAIHDARLNEYDDFTWKCVVVAALLHDIGHLIGMEQGDMEMRGGIGVFNNTSLGIVGHEGIGSAYLKDCGLPRLVYELVESHVMTKRYLCTTREGYYDKLSDASKETMRLQGGLMNDDELEAFRKKDMSELMIYIREYDDGGKNVNISGKKMDDYIEYINNLIK